MKTFKQFNESVFDRLPDIGVTTGGVQDILGIQADVKDDFDYGDWIFIEVIKKADRKKLAKKLKSKGFKTKEDGPMGLKVTI